MTDDTRSYVAYYRVSTKRQGRSGLGLEAQQHEVARYVAAQGGLLIGAFTETESGKLDDRPELRRALATCRLKRAVFVVAKLDRLSRRASMILRIIEGAKVEVVVLDHPHATKLSLTIYAAIAEEEGEKISERTRAALLAAKRRGAKLGGHPERLSRAARRAGAQASAALRAEGALKYAQDLAPVIREFCPCAKSLRQIADCLNAHGWPAPLGGEWSAIQVHRVLKRIEMVAQQVRPNS